MRIETLSEEWKKTKEEAELVKQKEGSAEAKSDAPGPDESSDVEEVVVEEDEKPVVVPKKPPRAKRSGGAPKNADGA